MKYKRKWVNISEQHVRNLEWMSIQFLKGFYFKIVPNYKTLLKFFLVLN